MTTSRSRFLTVSLILVVVLTVGSLLGAQGRRSAPAPDSLYKYLSVFTETLSLVRQAYVEEVDLHALLGGAYAGAVEALDPFSVYVAPENVSRFLEVRQNGNPDTGLFLLRERGWLYVAGVVDGSPAHAAKLQRGDLLSKVDGQSTTTMEVWEIHERFARSGGGSVKLEVIRRQDRRDVELRVAPYEQSPVTVREVEGVPVVRLSRFVSETPAEAARVLGALPGRYAVIDLRGVAGGDPRAAYRVADLLVTGELGSLRRKGEVRERFSSSGEPVWRGELVVLVDRGTLGAGEVLAQVLSESAGAKLVGEPTFGHAGRQDLVHLASGALLSLTDSFYTGPNGEVIDKSVKPDQLVDERSRKLREKDLTLDELILRRGLETLRGGESPDLEKAA
jgi:carboxyl-terminal processing protease